MTSEGRVRAVIADDEPHARRRLSSLIGRQDWIECVGQAEDGLSARQMIEQLRPDVVFLDIRMPRLDGTAVLESLSVEPHVVFVTAFSEFAVTAFDLLAVDYILKPYSAVRFSQTLERLRWTLSHPEAPSALTRARVGLDGHPLARLFVRSGPAIVPVATNGVWYFRAQRDYVEVYTQGARHLVHATLSGIERRLDPDRFVRIHRSLIVNLDHVSAFRRGEHGRLEAVLHDGTRLAVGRRRASEIRGISR